jgi:hypothetical protein
MRPWILAAVLFVAAFVAINCGSTEPTSPTPVTTGGVPSRSSNPRRDADSNAIADSHAIADSDAVSKSVYGKRHWSGAGLGFAQSRTLSAARRLQILRAARTDQIRGSTIRCCEKQAVCL